MKEEKEMRGKSIKYNNWSSFLYLLKFYNVKGTVLSMFCIDSLLILSTTLLSLLTEELENQSNEECLPDHPVGECYTEK